LDIKALLDVGCKTVANMIKGKSPEEIRKTFNIQNDLLQRKKTRSAGRTSGLRSKFGPSSLAFDVSANSAL
jgi:hypothetical protein